MSTITYNGTWSGSIATDKVLLELDRFVVKDSGEHVVYGKMDSSNFGSMSFGIDIVVNGETVAQGQNFAAPNVGSIDATWTGDLSPGDVVAFEWSAANDAGSGSFAWTIDATPATVDPDPDPDPEEPGDGSLPSNAFSVEDIDMIYFGTNEADALYKGELLVWRSLPAPVLSEVIAINHTGLTGIVCYEGHTLAIIGEHFTPGSYVMIGDVRVNPVSAPSPYHMSIIIPSMLMGVYDLRVVNEGGESGSAQFINRGHQLLFAERTNSYQHGNSQDYSFPLTSGAVQGCPAGGAEMRVRVRASWPNDALQWLTYNRTTGYQHFRADGTQLDFRIWSNTTGSAWSLNGVSTLNNPVHDGDYFRLATRAWGTNRSLALRLNSISIATEYV